MCNDEINNSYNEFGETSSEFEPIIDRQENEPVLKEEISETSNNIIDNGFMGEEDVFQEEPTKKTKRVKKTSSQRPLFTAIIISIVLSVIFGICGGAVTYSLLNRNNTINENNIDETPKEFYLSQESLNNVQIAEKASPSVVEISTESIQTSFFMQQYVTDGAGSGVIISEDGYIVTNYHVVENVNKITVKTKDGTSYNATLIGTDQENDLAVIKVNASGLTAAEYGDSSSLVVGEKAIAIGNPLGSLGGTVSEGIISALDREISLNGQKMRLLQTSAAINPGNSGGGLFNEKAQLIGIVNAKSAGSEIEGLGFAIPVNTVKESIDNIMNNSPSTSPTGVKLGITALTINDERTAAVYRVSRFGVYVVKVEMNSNAANAGLQTGDCITKINDYEITVSEDLTSALKKISAGENLEITYIRGEQEYTVSVLAGNFE